MLKLTHCGLGTPYGNIDLSKHWFRQWLVAWWHRKYSLDMSLEMTDLRSPRGQWVSYVIIMPDGVKVSGIRQSCQSCCWLGWVDNHAKVQHLAGKCTVVFSFISIFILSRPLQFPNIFTHMFLGMCPVHSRESLKVLSSVLWSSCSISIGISKGLWLNTTTLLIY